MLDRTDKFFVQPRLALAARKVEIFDAINLVIYAKIPLVSGRRGKDLIAGFVSLDNAGTPAPLLWKWDDRALLAKYAPDINNLTYPVSPVQYEALLERMTEANESALPYFYHEHHFLVDRKRRAELFLQLHTELRRLVDNDKIILQITDSERARMLVGHAWMTADTLRGYLRTNGVEPWWSDEENIQTHSKLERILLSDGLDYGRLGPVGVDCDQLPSYLFASMLLRRGSNPSRPVTKKNWSAPIVPIPAENAISSQVVEDAVPLDLRNDLDQSLLSDIADTSAVDWGESKDIAALLVGERLGTDQGDQSDQGDQGDQGDQAGQSAQRDENNLTDIATEKRLKVALPSAQQDFARDTDSDIPGGSSSLEMPEASAVPLTAGSQRAALPKDEVTEGETSRKSGAADEAPLMTKKDVAEFLNVSINTVDNYRKMPGFPLAVVLANNTIRWDREDLMVWRNGRKKVRSEGGV